MADKLPEQDVVVRDVQMPFLSMVVFMVKWALAAIPAMLVLLSVALAFGVLAYTLLGSLLGVGNLLSQRARKAEVVRNINVDSLRKATHEDLPAFGELVYVDKLPEAITKVAPEYPSAARDAGVEGKVLVQALVSRDGRVKATVVVESIPLLDESALAAVRQWVFEPAEVDNKPVAEWITIPVRFTLQ